MSDTAAPTLITDPAMLSEDAQALWARMIALTSERAFNAERVFPGAALPPLHQEVWTASDALKASVPGFLNNRLLRASLFMHQQQLPEAEAEARFVVSNAACSNQGHAILKRVLALRGALEEGAKIHAAAAAMCPDLEPFESAGLYLLGELRYTHTDEAVAAWTAHLEQQPDDSAVAMALAELFLAMDELEAAQKVLEIAAPASPDHLDLRLLLGSLRAEHEDLKGARSDFQLILEADEYHGKARMHLARVWAEVGDMKTALKLLKEGAAENTGDPDYNMLFGQVAMAMEQTELAGTAFVRALAAEPDEEEEVLEAEEALLALGLWHENNVRLQYLLADRAINAGEGLKAIKHLSNIQQTGVDNRELYLKMAEAHHAMGLLDDPLNFLVLAKSKKRRTYDSHGVEDPSDKRLDLLMLSLLLAADYPREDAMPKLEAHLNPATTAADEPETYFLTLADCCARVGEVHRAQEALRIAIERNPLDPLPWMELASLLDATEDAAGAVRTWRQVWELTGPDADIARHLSAAYETLGELPWAAYYNERAAMLEEADAEDEGESE